MEGNVFTDDGEQNGTGGAAYIVTEDGNVTISKNIFRNNRGYEGGALYILANATTTVRFNEFYRNGADNGSQLVSRSGGALFALTDGGTFVIANNLFIENYARDRGGAIEGGVRNDAGKIAITNNTVISNRTGKEGGGLYVSTFADDAKVYIENNIFKNNENNGTEISIHNEGNGGGSDVILNDNYSIQVCHPMSKIKFGKTAI